MYIIIKIFYLIRNLIRVDNKVAVLAPAGPGSLGDQALMQGMFDALSKRGDEMVEILHVFNEEKQHLRKPHSSLSGNYGSGRLSLVALVWKILRFKSFVIIGADTLDGGYSVNKNLFWIKLLNVVAAVDIPCSVVSFSFSDNPNSEVINAIKMSNRKIKYFSRDVNSRLRFESFTGRECLKSADLAFLVEPSNDGGENIEPAKIWVQAKKAKNQIVLGVNINIIMHIDDEQLIVDNVSKVINYQLNQFPRLNYILVPHDFRGRQSDVSLLEKVYEEITTENLSRVFLVSARFNCWNAKDLMGYVDALITGRMHLAIAALGRAKAVFCLSYKNKFEGLMTLFGIQGNLVSSDTLLVFNNLNDFFTLAITEYESQSRVISNSLAEVKTLSESNIGD